ncbi:MAG: hydrogenase nickel incorporation protein HypB [Spirochaetia bacterium]|nr:hydrogenase nickel incorporation protein HypB [Spirochaetia bacterium]
MCEDCGCSISQTKSHVHDHERGHNHPHVHKHVSENINLTVIAKILEKNNLKAEEIRAFLAEKNIFCVNLMSSPGGGKTSLLEETAKFLGKKMSVIEGDLETNKDADRIKKHGIQAYQITTGQTCHLDAVMVKHGLSHLNLENIEYLFIENVGNLVCPASYDVGSHLNVALLSIPEGDDKAAKYPVMIRKADCVLISKTDLLPHFEYNIENVKKDIEAINPHAQILNISIKNKESISGWIDFLQTKKSP